VERAVRRHSCQYRRIELDLAEADTDAGVGQTDAIDQLARRAYTITP
jgi:hypothetical protein